MLITEDEAWLQIRGLGKHFGGVRALTDIDFDVQRGEIHGLVGANGAGKSTLIRCLAGVAAADSGQFSVDQQEVRIDSPRDAESLGFSFIHQELNVVPRFSAIENILLGTPKVKRAGMVDWKASCKMAVNAAETVGLDFPLDRPVEELTVAERWLVMISKALVRRSTLIAMDEPTASLSAAECERLFGIVRSLAAGGVAVLYVSHHLDEVLDLSDRITVFRDGRVVETRLRKAWDKRALVRSIVGSDVETNVRPTYLPLAPERGPIFEARGVTSGNVVQDISLSVFPGEILGLGGLVGSGRTEFVRLAFGADRLDSGSFVLDGRPFAPKSVSEAVARGVGLVPEERRSQGLLLDKSVGFNMNVTVLKALRTTPKLPFMSTPKRTERANRLIEQLSIKTPSQSVPVGALSGGNQQKVLIAHWLTPGIKLLFLDEPSKGVDVGARQEIHEAIRQLTGSGVGVVLVSSEPEELVMLCDRVIVLRRGRTEGELVGEEITEQRIIEMSFGFETAAEGVSL